MECEALQTIIFVNYTRIFFELPNIFFELLTRLEGPSSLFSHLTVGRLGTSPNPENNFSKLL